MENDDNLNKLTCYCCRSAYNESDSFCGVCGYPLKGTKEEQKQFSTNYYLNKIDIDNVKVKIKQARLILYVLSGFTVITGLVLLLKDNNNLLFIVNLILAGIYLGLGFWARKKAFAAIFTGFLIYITIILLNGIFTPLTLINGIVFKVIFIIAFIKATYGAYKFKIDEG